ncbi:MAG: B12-binding domain-containing radical SAM protein [Desulfobacterales bacterium]|nr:B12-binding domain-containing radical SAM protein [Desulfobacterales bacterium]
MKIALIIPKNSSDNKQSFYDYKFYAKFLLTKKYISYLLAIPTIAALTPPKHEIRIFDENIEEIDYTWGADLAGITVRTMFAKRAYAISANFRSKGVKTVLGGIHPSMCTEEASQHCDAVVVGEAENIWAKLLQDVEDGNLKQIYKAEEFVDMTTSPTPNRKALRRDHYFSDILQTAKGCPFHCEFCSVHAFDGQKIRNKTIEQVLKEVEDIKSSGPQYKKKNAIFFADDNIIANKKFVKELFIALKPYNINWMCQASINISQEDELLELMRDCGCGAVFIGFESISKNNLKSMDKGINQKFDYIEAINKIQSYGILVHSSFIVGYDFDTLSSFDELINFIEASNLLIPLINILTPFPGTKLFKRFEEEGRIIHKDWSRYDTKNVVFYPTKMSPDLLFEGFKKVVKSIYSFDSILKKLNYYWNIDFWKRSNELDPVKFKYRLMFALRLITLLASGNTARSKFILKILPRVFDKRVRISNILALMAYNDFSESL